LPSHDSPTMATWWNCRTMSFSLIIIQLLLVLRVYSTQIRGVPTSKLSFYVPGKDFTCLDGSVTISFGYVNDDYCDCPDGSDEPGTSACPNGKFTCKNLGHKALVLQSSRVNDGVCDCCDGTDEYDSDAVCTNHCQEAGRAEQERLEQERHVAQLGYEVKLEYMQKGKEKKQEVEAETRKLKDELEEHKGKLDELKAAKERAEEFEKEAKEKQDKEFEELEKQRKERENYKNAEEAFEKLDTDGNGMISVSEFVSSSHTSADLTEEQVKEKLSGDEEIDRQKIHELWPSIEDFFVKVPEKPIDEAQEPKGEDTTQTDPPEQKATDLTEDDYDDDDSEEEETEGGEPKPPEPVPPPPETKDENEAQGDGKPEYSEETKRLISIADQARKEFSEIETQINSVESRISTNEKLLGIDFGSDNEFLALHNECFTYDDREYTYKLCPFNSATQSSKSGGADTSLGTWGHWHGSPDLYSRMKYVDGLSCWNGPNRSADVIVSCGAKNEIVSVTEPNRCEYVMEFKTPAMCKDPSQSQHNIHEEL